MARRGPIQCPACGAGSARPSRTRGIRERLLRWLGYDFARCRACLHRFPIAPVLDWRSLAYARCPKCLRMDLTVWDPGQYYLSRLTRLGIWLGANRWRCDPCRANFLSFLPRKGKSKRTETAAGVARHGEPGSPRP